MGKGIGPRRLGSPLKMSEGEKPAVMSGDEILGALRNKKQKTGTGGIKMDNTLVGVGAGTAVKAGIKKIGAKTAGKFTGRRSGALADAAVSGYEAVGKG